MHLSDKTRELLIANYGESFGKSLSSTQGGNACHIKELPYIHPAFDATMFIVRVVERRVADRKYETFLPYDGRVRAHWANRTVYEKVSARYEVIIVNEWSMGLDVVGICTTIATARRLFTKTKREWGGDRNGPLTISHSGV